MWRDERPLKRTNGRRCLWMASLVLHGRVQGLNRHHYSVSPAAYLAKSRSPPTPVGASAPSFGPPMNPSSETASPVRTFPMFVLLSHCLRQVSGPQLGRRHAPGRCGRRRARVRRQRREQHRGGSGASRQCSGCATCRLGQASEQLWAASGPVRPSSRIAPEVAARNQRVTAMPTSVSAG
jgi:hypothetical protein